MKPKFFFYFLLPLLLFLYGMGEIPPHKYVPVRVLVLRDVTSVSIAIKGSYKIFDFETGGFLQGGKKIRELILNFSDIKGDGIKILPEGKARIYMNKRVFRGGINIIKNKDRGDLFVVNEVDLEDYVCGVLYHEVSHRWPIEAIKTQAIASRTYALYEKLISKNKYFDLYSDIYSQVYGGKTSETFRTTRAVILTQGLILSYNGKVFPTYYHATCAGQTTDAGTIWDIDIPTLYGVKCDFCKSSPHYEWEREFKISDIEKGLKNKGYEIELKGFEILKRDGGNRVEQILLKGKNKDVELKGNKFRLAVGPNEIKSTNFEVELKGRFVTFRGKGWGHGVGMCQWGAYGMAREGWRAEEILGYYYPGAEIIRVE